MFKYFNAKRKIPGISKLVKACQSSRYPETSSQCKCQCKIDTPLNQKNMISLMKIFYF